MTLPYPRHAATDPGDPGKPTRTVRFWVVPIVLSVAVLSALAGLYLGGILNPATNLRHFPVAVVNEDNGPVGAQIVDGLVGALDKDKFDVRVLSAADAAHQLDTAQLYGELHIPADFSSALQTFAAASLQPGQATKPVLTVSTNPRAGTLGAGIAGQTLGTAAAKANEQIGQRVSSEVAQRTGGAPVPAGVTMALAHPLDVQTDVHNPLPNGTGNGLSAFYYALLLLLAGFTGSVVVSTLVDSMLGYVPAEFGPVYRFAEQAQISRFRTLLAKWALMILLALITSGLYLAIAHGLGMPIPSAWALWGFGVFTIAAVGITATSMIAVLGTLGLLVNMLVFVILGLPSAGATVPLQAAPPFFGWLAKFEPMHQVFLGVRALLYLGGRGDAGLHQALWMTAVGLVIGILLGAVVTTLYDRRGYHRIPGAVTAARAE
ncbi:MAG TPA: YhgE/Pip domain-containing protein [Mycobacterium sp.]|nr:YhgE/Pip domain-containing protein [Mycobacterium sp.]